VAGSRKELGALGRWRRLVDYVAACMTFLRRLPSDGVTAADLRSDGSFAGVPVVNALYAHLSRMARDHDERIVFVKGLGTDDAAIPANLWLEGTLGSLDARYSRDRAGLSNLVSEFSWPPAFGRRAPSLVREGRGNALMYALSVAMKVEGTLVACVLSSDQPQSWHGEDGVWLANDVLDAGRGSSVLPIVCGPFSNEEDYGSYGYAVRDIEPGMQFEARMEDALEWARTSLRAQVHTGWPLLRVALPHDFGMPADVQSALRSTDGLASIDAWFKSWHFEELVDAAGAPKPDILALLPSPHRRLGQVILDTARQLSS
jgi:xylulose-5-phosphate/fructose-6-phosphate phosphoketolase